MVNMCTLNCLIYLVKVFLGTLKKNIRPEIKIQSLSLTSTLMLMEHRVKFCSPQNISGASQQNTAVAMSSSMGTI